jgi:predicted component of type VI protein secretion system
MDDYGPEHAAAVIKSLAQAVIDLRGQVKELQARLARLERRHDGN